MTADDKIRILLVALRRLRTECLNGNVPSQAAIDSAWHAIQAAEGKG